jgi:hypothetical protein
MLDPGIKNKWIEALTSGSYLQCSGQLKGRINEDSGDEGYCCLGVLADIINPEGWEFNNWVESGNDHEYTESFDMDLPSSILPIDIQKKLIIMNDDGCSFERIAEEIRSTDGI